MARLINSQDNNPPRLYVEAWTPTYGSPFELVEDVDDLDILVDPTVETTDWEPITPDTASEDAPQRVAFVDGVRRVEAWLTLDDPDDGLLPAVLGAWAVGATVWDRTVPTSSFWEPRVGRSLVLSGGHRVRLTDNIDIAISSDAVVATDRAGLLRHIQERMRSEERQLATALAALGHLVIADGTLRGIGVTDVVGYTKTHRVRYLTEAEHADVIRALGGGQRTPMFLIGRGGFKRYAWYLRLSQIPGGHSWTGVVRCEVPVGTGPEMAARIAGWTAVLLPQVASQPFREARAPQNLVPVAALERMLRQRLGDARLVNRALRAAVAGNLLV